VTAGLDLDAIVAALADAAPGASIERADTRDGLPTLVAAAGDVVPLMRALHDRADLAFECLAEFTAVDYWPREPRFEVVYILLSVAHGTRLRIKVRVAGARPALETVSGIWPAANWLEREVWDMFGIDFTGHPDLRRLLTPEDWEGHPLRKDYPVQIRKPARSTEPLQVTPEEFRANLEHDRRARQSEPS
jgi:NADH-quinone oxidoreductase subunit C